MQKIDEAGNPLNYGDYVKMNDRFESVHIWSEELEKKAAGKWTPLKISKEEYDEELKYCWNKCQK